LNNNIKLQMSDYISLISLLDGKVPPWDVSSMKRCQNAGLIQNQGHWLTAEGERKARIAKTYVDSLKAGLPLSARMTTREMDLVNEPWYRMELQGVEALVNRAAIIYKKGAPHWMIMHSRRAELPDDSSFRWTIIGALKTSNFRKMQPYAVQIDQLGGHELICFYGITKASIKVRIQSKYYDYITRNCFEHAWWLRNDGEFLFAKSEHRSGKGLRDGIIAVVRPFQLEREYPPENCYHGKKSSSENSIGRPCQGIS
jgi:hypothetical protein